MMAKVIWNITKTYSGMVAARLLALSIFTPDRKRVVKSPTNLLTPSLALAVKLAL